MASYVKHALKRKLDNLSHQLFAGPEPKEHTNMEVNFERTDRPANIEPLLDPKSSPEAKTAQSSNPVHHTAVHFRDLEDSDKDVEFARRKNALRSSNPSNGKNRPFTAISKDEVRLAVLYPGDFTKPLEISIFTVKIFDLPKYEYQALSYAWNFFPTDGWQTVLIRNQGIRPIENEPYIQSPDTSGLQIRQDTYRAVQKLRNDQTPVFIWVDVVCLDVANVEEKKIQSANFAEIFYHASSVVFWLGDSYNSVLEDLPSAEDYPGGRMHPDDFIFSSRTFYWFESLVELLNDKFSRRWTVQEIALARNLTLRYADKTLDWSIFQKVFERWNSSEELGRQKLRDTELITERVVSNNTRIADLWRKNSVKSICEIRQRMIREKSNGLIIESLINIDELVVILSGFSNANPKDAIHAFVSLAADTVHFNPPNRGDLETPKGVRCVEIRITWAEAYEMGVLETFVNFIQHSISKSGSMDIICCSWAPRNSGQLPSWIKETDKLKESRNPTIYHFAQLNKKKKGGYNSANSMKPVYRIERRPNYSSKSKFFETLISSGASETAVFVLLVEGISLGFIEETSSRMARGLITRECLELGGLDLSAQETSTQQHDVLEMLWRTLEADRTFEGDKPPNFHQIFFTNCLNQSIDGDMETGIEWDGDYTETTEFLQVVYNVTYNRKLFRFGDDEMLGLGPAEMEAGDMVCILFGCSVPVILRERLSGIAPYFEFIGECFVYGVMEGEWISGIGAEELKRKTREFEIR